MAASGAPSLTATARKPGGRRVTRSPWLIQTCSRPPRSQMPSNSAHSSVISTKARPYSRTRTRLHLAAELHAHRLLAVADAQHRHALLEDRLRRRAGARLGGAGRPAGEDDGARRERRDPRGLGVERQISQ